MCSTKMQTTKTLISKGKVILYRSVVMQWNSDITDINITEIVFYSLITRASVSWGKTVGARG